MVVRLGLEAGGAADGVSVLIRRGREARSALATM